MAMPLRGTERKRSDVGKKSKKKIVTLGVVEIIADGSGPFLVNFRDVQTIFRILE